MDRSLLPAKLSYLLNCISSAAIWNFIAVYYQKVGFSKTEIGILQAIPAFCFIIGAPLFGAVADKFQQQRLVHIITIIGGSVLMFSLRFISNFNHMCVMMSLASLVSAPIGSLLDQTVMSLLNKLGGEYGKQRLYGGIGYGLGAYLTGQLVAMYDIDWMFNVHIFSAMVSVYVLTFLAPSDPITSTLPRRLTSIMDQLKTKPDVTCLFGLVFLLGLMFGVISSFLTLYLFNLSHGDPRVVGVAIFCETVSELPAFFYADRIVKKLGTSTVLCCSILAYFVRLTYYSVMTNAWSVLPFELLHGISFSLSWAACTNYIFAAAAPGTDGTMMGLLSSMLNGYGKGLGTLAGGYIYKVYGPVLMWQTARWGVALALAGLALFHRLQPTQETNQNDNQLCAIVKANGMLSPARAELSLQPSCNTFPNESTLLMDV